MLMLNLGCGDRFRPGWRNFDFVGCDGAVESHNLLEELPFDDDSVDVIYHSHVLEHFTQGDARTFLGHCHRKLKPGGVIRVVVPDLENICREYLKVLERAVDGSAEDREKHGWMTIELMDQMVRTKPGGEMADFWNRAIVSNDRAMIDYVRERTGRKLELLSDPGDLSQRRVTFRGFKQILLLGYLKLVQLLVPQPIREVVFDRTPFGEKHRWMYDRYSLKELLESVGFVNVQFFGPEASSIPCFVDYHLDSEEDHQPYKRSSLYCEAFR